MKFFVYHNNNVHLFFAVIFAIFCSYMGQHSSPDPGFSIKEFFLYLVFSSFMILFLFVDSPNISHENNILLFTYPFGVTKEKKYCIHDMQNLEFFKPIKGSMRFNFTYHEENVRINFNCSRKEFNAFTDFLESYGKELKITDNAWSWY